MRRKFVAGNWKMNGSLAENQTRLTQLSNALGCLTSVDVAVFSASPYLSQCESLLSSSSIKWGAQNISGFSHGAYTGDVNAAMLQDFGCHYTLVGHSERRELFAETNAQVAAKFMRAQAGNITPILCVGETLQERESGDTVSIISQQIQAVLDVVGIKKMAKSVIAYEPIWAIGTGKTASPEQAQQVHAAIRALLAKNSQGVAQKVQILYGGSVKPSNAAGIFSQPDVDGALVGGASLNANDFIEICKAAG